MHAERRARNGGETQRGYGDGMAQRLVVRANRTWVDGAWQPAAVVVDDGVITAIGAFDDDSFAAERVPDTSGAPAGYDVTLPDDEVLMPGLVDVHVHVNEPGRTEWEGFTTATRAAAAGGITTIIDMPLNSIPPTTTPDALRVKQQAAAPQLSVDVGFWGGAIPASLGHLRELQDAGVFGFKCFLAPSGVDEFPHLDRAQLRRAQAEIAAFDGLLIVHAEDAHVLDAHAYGGGPRYADFVASRPDEAELDAIQAVIDGVRATGCRSHILHLSSAAALPLIAAAKAEGLPISAETCPHYLVFSADEIADGGTRFKCCPPIRDAANRDALWAGLEAGTIDLIASDHSPSTAELKFQNGGDFGVSWGGISGLQVSLPAVWTAARERGIPLERVIGWMGESSAGFVGLAGRGRIRVGGRGDLVAFAADREFTVHADALAHKNPVTAFDGVRLDGVVTRTWLAGETVFRLGDRSDHAGAGALLTRQTASVSA